VIELCKVNMKEMLKKQAAEMLDKKLAYANLQYYYLYNNKKITSKIFFWHY
jgi:hypothetical protein